MSVHTILITATRQQALAAVVINRGPAGPAGPEADLPVGLADFTSITISPDDDLELVKDGVTFWTPLNRRP